MQIFTFFKLDFLYFFKLLDKDMIFLTQSVLLMILSSTCDSAPFKMEQAFDSQAVFKISLVHSKLIVFKKIKDIKRLIVSYMSHQDPDI